MSILIIPEHLKLPILTLKHSKQTLLLSFCIFILPFFDIITGAFFKLGLMGEGALGSPSQIGRLVALVILIFFIFDSKIDNKIKKNTLFFILFFTSVEVFVALIHKELVAFLYGLVFFSKLLFCFLTYNLLKDWVFKSPLHYELLFRLTVIYGALLSLLLLASFLSGFHISNYGSKFATRGLFASGNGIGITIGVASLLSLYYSYKTQKTTYYFLAFFMIVCTAIIGTKTAFLFLLISSSFFIVLSVRKFPIITLIVFSIFIIYILPTLLNLLSMVFENIIYKFNNIEDKTALLASSRDVFIKNAFSKFNLDGFSSLRVIFGGGAYFSYESLLLPIEFKRKLLENDLFELFFCYGLIGSISYIVFLSYNIIQTLFVKLYFLSFCLILISLHSILAGHVLFNGTSSIMLVFILLLIKPPDFKMFIGHK